MCFKRPFGQQGGIRTVVEWDGLVKRCVIINYRLWKAKVARDYRNINLTQNTDRVYFEDQRSKLKVDISLMWSEKNIQWFGLCNMWET